MKKLMIAAVASMAAVGAFAVESANVVGYLQSDKGQGVDMAAAAFDTVGGGEVDVQSLLPVVGGEEELYSGGFMLMTLTDAGETEETYIYTLAADAPDGKDGWFDSVTGERVVKTFKPGEGFVTVSDYEGGKLQSAGQVSDSASVFVLRTGVNGCGNTTSAAVSIEDVGVGVGVDAEGNLLTVNPDNDEELYSGGIMIMTLTDGGETDKTYIYTLAADASDGVAGWFDSVTGERVSINILAGAGFVVVSDYTEGCITLPSAL